MQVVKTRIQVKGARFDSVREAVPTILKEEGKHTSNLPVLVMVTEATCRCP